MLRSISSVRLVLFAAFIAMALARPAFAESRIALVIGNSTYPQIGTLPNPANDAKLMADTLRKLDFEVLEHTDVNQKGMKRAIVEFGKKLANAGKDSVGLFYYAGHGVQVDGTNYLIPVNVNITTEADVDIEAVSADTVLRQMAYAQNRLNIIVMDACRNNPFKRGFRSVSRGLAKMDAAKGTLIAYATAPGDVAVDGTGKNSPYTWALAKTMLMPGQTVERVFKEVRNSVVEVTNSQQVPWEASSLVGADFYFSPPKPGADVANSDLTDPEIVFWQSVQNSTDPRVYQTYLDQYPNGLFAVLARAKIAELSGGTKMANLGPATGPVRFTPGTHSVEKISGNNECRKVVFKDFSATSDDIEGRWSHPDAFGNVTIKLVDGLISARMTGNHINGYHETAQIDGPNLLVNVQLRYSGGSCNISFRIDNAITR